MFEKIAQPRILHEILGQIKQNIASGELKKGDRLPSERHMAELFGVSRSVIREALKSLEMIGLIECLQGDGNYITTHMDNSLTEPLSIMFMLEGGTLVQVQQLRRILETASVSLAATQIGSDDLDSLTGYCARLESGGQIAEEAALDRSFHLAIALASGNPLLITLQRAVSSLIESQIRDVRDAMLRKTDIMSHVNQQHRAIVAALGSGDAKKAVAAMNEHLDTIESYLPDNS